jgi:hypothetical protein
MCMYSVSPRQQGDPEGECCEVRLLLLRNEAATSEIIPALCIGRTKLIGNQLGLHVVYIASCIPQQEEASFLLRLTTLFRTLLAGSDRFDRALSLCRGCLEMASYETPISKTRACCYTTFLGFTVSTLYER